MRWEQAEDIRMLELSEYHCASKFETQQDKKLPWIVREGNWEVEEDSNKNIVKEIVDTTLDGAMKYFFKVNS